MLDVARTHAALFDELERQGIFRVDVGKLTRAVFETRVVISDAAASQHGFMQCVAVSTLRKLRVIK